MVQGCRTRSSGTSAPASERVATRDGHDQCTCDAWWSTRRAHGGRGSPRGTPCGLVTCWNTRCRATCVDGASHGFGYEFGEPFLLVLSSWSKSSQGSFWKALRNPHSMRVCAHLSPRTGVGACPSIPAACAEAGGVVCGKYKHTCCIIMTFMLLSGVALAISGEGCS